jgi:hypothetical protein
MSKRATLLLIAILTVSSLLMVIAAPASASTPSVPEFTVKFVDHSYVVPTSTSIDPYTGQQIVHPNYTVENKTIDIIIKNQPFAPPNNLTNLYYNVRVKGHFGENWTELYSISNNTPQNTLPMQSASENTVISTPQDYPAGGQVDFQVEAVIATAHPLYGTNFGYWSYETSGWSNTQTITIGESQTPTSPETTPTPDQTPTPTPSQEPPQTEQIEPIVGAAIVVAVIIAVLGLLIYLIKRK